MKKIYHIEIEEILQRVCEIEAESLEEAMDIAKEKYDNEEYVLDAEDIKETVFREYPDTIKVKKERER